MKNSSKSKKQEAETKAEIRSNPAPGSGIPQRERSAAGAAADRPSGIPVVIRWFLSKTVRHAVAMRKHVHRILCAQQDILSPAAVQAVTEGLENLSKGLRAGMTKPGLLEEMSNLETVANKWLKPYPHAAWRENVEVLLVALAVAMGIRTFFLQPFKIPTGSMQPTLFGITSIPDYTKSAIASDFEVPRGFARIGDWFAGNSYVTFTAEEDGRFDGISRPLRFLIFNVKQTIWFSGKPHNIWFPPDGGTGQTYRAGNLLRYLSALISSLPVDNQSPPDLERRMGLRRGTAFFKGQHVLKIKVISGDHLFVDRLTYNFRKPTRGEIIVFETTGTPIPQQDTFYIKRLVGLGGETIQIGNDRHLIINGERLSASTPHFEHVYTFDPQQPPEDSQYSGHLNQRVASAYHRGDLARYFPDETTRYEIPAGHLMVMGDNTVNSFDSRGWGEFSESKVIGKSYFVYWPITSRFGWGHR